MFMRNKRSTSSSKTWSARFAPTSGTHTIVPREHVIAALLYCSAEFSFYYFGSGGLCPAII